LTGEAGVFLDPFYSPGSDMIAISNGLIGDLIIRDLDGEDIEERAAIHNRLLLLLNDSWRNIYEHQYPLMGNAQVMVAKVIWDTVVYWAVPGLLYFHDTLRRVIDTPEILMHLLRFSLLSEHVQAFFREWHAIDQSEASDAFIRYYDFDFMPRLHIGLVAGLSDAELEARVIENVHFVEQLTGQMVSTVIDELAEREEEAVQDQLKCWRTDPFLTELIALYRQEDNVNLINSSGWITLGRQRQDRREFAR